MMKKLIPLLLSIIINSNITKCIAQVYEGPIPPITNGYGAFGNQVVSVINFDNPQNTSSFENDVSIFYPSGTATPKPTLLFSHGYLATDTTFFAPLLNFIASKGFVAVYVPQTAFGVCENYPILLEGFKKAARDYSNIIDTTRIGIMGHSFGAGAIPWLGKKLMMELNWGMNARFLFSMAPWYAHLITQEDLESFPSDCALMMQVYEEDNINDHRMAMDIFNNINIPTSEKDFIIVKTNQVGSYTYSAGHSVPTQEAVQDIGTNVRYDAHDYYVVFRLLDAMMDYKFNANETAKNTALGNGSSAQINMGSMLSDLISTDNPLPFLAEDFFANPCNNTDMLACPLVATNPRYEYCDIMTSITNLEDNLSTENYLSIYPNPCRNNLNIEANHWKEINLDVVIYNIAGQIIKVEQIHDQDIKIKLNTKYLKRGTYVIELFHKQSNTRVIKKFIKK